MDILRNLYGFFIVYVGSALSIFFKSLFLYLALFIGMRFFQKKTLTKKQLFFGFLVGWLIGGIMQFTGNILQYIKTENITLISMLLGFSFVMPTFVIAYLFKTRGINLNKENNKKFSTKEIEDRKNN